MQAIFRKLPAWAAAAAFIAAAGAAHANLVTNGDFESGDLGGWSVTSSDGFAGADPFAAHGGNYGAFFGDSAPGSSLSQILSTVAGGSYQIDFWLQLDDSAQPNAFSWSWDGATQASLTDAAAFGYTHFSALLTAAGASTALQFDFVNPQSFWLLDDVNVSAVPEPSALALASTALLMLGALRRRAG